MAVYNGKKCGIKLQEKAAELMGIRLEVLHSLLHRAKKWIKKKYGTEYEEMNRED